MRDKTRSNAIKWTDDGQEQACPAREHVTAPDGNAKQSKPERADDREWDNKGKRRCKRSAGLVELTFRRKDQIWLNLGNGRPDQHVYHTDSHEDKHGAEGKKKAYETKPASSVHEAGIESHQTDEVENVFGLIASGVSEENRLFRMQDPEQSSENPPAARASPLQRTIFSANIIHSLDVVLCWDDAQLLHQTYLIEDFPVFDRLSILEAINGSSANQYFPACGRNSHQFARVCTMG
jgi:hypothetical protein